MSSFIKSAFYSNDIMKHSSHYHDCHQIIYIKTGCIEIAINGKSHSAYSGDIIIISRFENHSIKILSDDYVRYVLRLSTDLPHDKVFSIFTNRPEKFNNIISVANQKITIENIFDKIINEFSFKSNFAEQLQNLLLNELLIYVSRVFPYELSDYNSKSFNIAISLKNEFENYYFMEFKLENLAKKYNVSVSTLTHTFKKIVGVSVFEYLLSCRMAAAKKYLSKTDLTIGQIIEKCGFNDNSNFSRTFKKLNNITPLQFRKKYK